MFTSTAAPSTFRIRCRAGIDKFDRPCRFHAARKLSVLDRCMEGDADIAWRRDDAFDVFVGRLRLATVRGTPLDRMTFSNLLHQLRR
ncbi:MAG: hypothetical protein FJ271_08830 [Planctomycetes bacterium]|nr:hypothetical protein [Planctomycetota bacterium]